MTRLAARALAEIARQQPLGAAPVRAYSVRRSSMRNLAASGFVQRDPRCGSASDPVWLITTAGRARLLEMAP